MNKCRFNIINFETIDSTSTYLKRTYNEYEDLTIVFSSFQEEGHGRMKRVWDAPKGASLLFSILFKDKDIINNFESLSLLSAVTIFKFLSKYVSNISIKWPNDVYVNGKKICGILLESISYDLEISALVLGIGININTKEFNDEIKHKATSLFNETNKLFDLEILKEDLLNHLNDMVYDIKQNKKDYLDIVRKNNYLKDKIVKAYLNGVVQEVKVLDINDDNTLKVAKDDKIYHLNVGEVLPIN